MSDPAPSESKPVPPYRQWHRLFGLLLADYLIGTPFTVELEKDLSQKRQLLDVLVVRRGPGPMTRPMPDGLDDLADHNLITFKSFREPLDDWALKELTGHYVNYRKIISDAAVLLPEDRFHLYAVCARYPKGLFDAVSHEKQNDGVYVVSRGTDRIRVVVTKELREEEQNAMLHLFSSVHDKVKYGQEHYRLQSDETSTIVGQLFGSYRVEGFAVPYTIEDFKRDLLRDHMAEFPPGERLAGLAPEERLAGLAPEERLAGLSVREIESYLSRLRKNRGTGKAVKPRPSEKVAKRKPAKR